MRDQERRQSKFKHLNTITEEKDANKLEVVVLDTMKNIPSPDSFINSRLGQNNEDEEPKQREKSTRLIKNELETIQDDNRSSF